MYRELWEEIGLEKHHVKILAQTRGWLRYRLPRRYVRYENPPPVCIGQKQKWFLLGLVSHDGDINLNHCHPPEFDDWQWVSYWYPLNQVVSFKREVYRKALQELAPRTPTLHDTY
jgi:putative (di)nucleoside polyphosphate hydrolase